MAREAPQSDNLYLSELPGDFNEQVCQQILGAYGAIVRCKILPSKISGGKCAALVQFGSLDEAQWIVENLHGNIPQGLSEPIKVRYADGPEQKAQRQMGQMGPPEKAGWKGGKGGDGFGKSESFGKGWERSSPYPPAAWDMMAMKAGPMKGAKDWGGKDWGGLGGKTAAKGKSKGKDCGIQAVVSGLLSQGALPGGKWENDERTLYVAGLPWDTSDLDLYRIFAPFGAIASKGVRAMCNEDGSCKGIGFINYVEQGAAEMAIMTLNGAVLPDGRELVVKIKAGKGDGKGKGREADDEDYDGA